MLQNEPYVPKSNFDFWNQRFDSRIRILKNFWRSRRKLVHPRCLLQLPIAQGNTYRRALHERTPETWDDLRTRIHSWEGGRRLQIIIRSLQSAWKQLKTVFEKLRLKLERAALHADRCRENERNPFARLFAQVSDCYCPKLWKRQVAGLAIEVGGSETSDHSRAWSRVVFSMVEWMEGRVTG